MITGRPDASRVRSGPGRKLLTATPTMTDGSSSVISSEQLGDQSALADIPAQR
ncbi:hypothetical protein KVY23_02775 [Rhodococcus sp. I2R]|nr:hypothetical protein [uncultured Rhodococcus sp.]MCC8926717.1 hypothetical protein [Rhodococcus sp. I2R]